MKKSLFTRLVLALVVIATALAITPVTAQAKTRSVSVPPMASRDLSSIPSGAKRVYLGTTKVTFKKGGGTVYFKAPKTKTYTFTFSNVRSTKGDYVAGYFKAFRSNGTPYGYNGYPYELIGKVRFVKAAEGNDGVFLVRLRNRSISHWPRNMDADKPIPTMVARVKANKGDIIQLNFSRPQRHFSIASVKSYTAKTTARLRIR